jgi:hypothetical protein
MVILHSAIERYGSVLNDFSTSDCSSSSVSWNVGMTGWNPTATVADGFNVLPAASARADSLPTRHDSAPVEPLTSRVG